MENGEILLLVAILPIILICKYIYSKDREKEPKSLLIKLLISGVISTFIVLLISCILEFFLPFMKLAPNKLTFINLLLYSFIGVALVEESSKFLMTYLIGYKNKEFDELYDIIIYSIFVSLGFAGFENFLYIFGNSSIGLGILRGISAIPGHACDALFMGYYLSLAKLSQLKKDKKDERKNIIKSILIPTILHGIYDFCLLAQNNLFIITFIIFVISLYIISIKKLNYIARNNSKLTFKNKFCPSCGNKVNNNYCNKCGRKQN